MAHIMKFYLKFRDYLVQYSGGINFQMNTGLFPNRTTCGSFNTGVVWYSDSYCISYLSFEFCQVRPKNIRKRPFFILKKFVDQTYKKSVKFLNEGT